MLESCYSFVRVAGPRDVKLWPSVRTELETWEAFSSLLASNLRAEWSSEVVAADAFDWGVGACSSYVPQSEAAELGRWAEGRRLSSEDVAPRVAAAVAACQEELGELGGGDAAGGGGIGAAVGDGGGGDGRSLLNAGAGPVVPPSLPCLAPSTAYLPPVPDSAAYIGHKSPILPKRATSRPWKVVVSKPWRNRQLMPVLGARACLFVVKRLLRSSRNFGGKLLVLGDSVVACCALAKGRQGQLIPTSQGEPAGGGAAPGFRLFCRAQVDSK